MHAGVILHPASGQAGQTKLVSQHSFFNERVSKSSVLQKQIFQTHDVKKNSKIKKDIGKQNDLKSIRGSGLGRVFVGVSHLEDT